MQRGQIRVPYFEFVDGRNTCGDDVMAIVMPLHVRRQFTEDSFPSFVRCLRLSMKEEKLAAIFTRSATVR